jgi:hypothetical protein
LVAGPLKPHVTRAPGKHDPAFDVTEGKRLQQAIRKCWTPGGGGLPEF